jgi:hypothetical protein
MNLAEGFDPVGGGHLRALFDAEDLVADFAGQEEFYLFGLEAVVDEQMRPFFLDKVGTVAGQGVVGGEGCVV